MKEVKHLNYKSLGKIKCIILFKSDFQNFILQDFGNHWKFCKTFIRNMNGRNGVNDKHFQNHYLELINFGTSLIFF